jgi:hypothetical protein
MKLETATAFVYRGLTVEERFRLILQNFKDDKPQNMDLLDHAPEKQTTRLNRLIGLMNAANGDLAHLAVILHERAQAESLRLSWLQWAHICAAEAQVFQMYFDRCAAEPVTESEYKMKEEEARKAFVPVEECANIIAEEFHAYDNADYETHEDGFSAPTDEAWYRVRDQMVKELASLARAGTLISSGNGRALKIQCGALYDWLGQPTPAVPASGARFEVLPDHRAEEVRRLRDDHEFVRSLLERSAVDFALPLNITEPFDLEVRPRGFDVELARFVVATVKRHIEEGWQEVRAIEDQVELIADELDGEDPLHPRVRRNMDGARDRLLDVHKSLQKYTGPFELPEPDTEIRDKITRIVEREARVVHRR